MDDTTARINALALSEMQNLPMLYGPNSIDGPSGPPANLIAALEVLETTPAVDSSNLTGSQTVASVENETVTDLQTLSQATADEIKIASLGAVSENIIEQFVFSDQPMQTKATAALIQDSTEFVAGGPPTVTIVQPPSPPTSGVEQFLVADTTTGVSDWENGSTYSGPVSGVTNAFISVSPDNLNVTSNRLGNFIHTGAGNDAINVSMTTFAPQSSGTTVNVLDGGGGSNFLVGNTIHANDFFLDDRNPTSDTVSTVVNLHQGDTVTIFGVDQSHFQMATADNFGAPGYTGLDIGFLAAGHPNANVVLTGYASADLTSGKLSVSYGTTPALPGLPGSDYALITAMPGAFPSTTG